MEHRNLPQIVTIDNRASTGKAIDAVWSAIGAFDELDLFLDVTCELIGGDGGIGSVRLINGMIVEPMVGASDHSYTYVQTHGPMSTYSYHGCVGCVATGPSTTEIFYTLVYDESRMDEDRRASERDRLKMRFAGAVAAMTARAELSNYAAGVNESLVVTGTGGGESPGLQKVRAFMAASADQAGIGRTLGIRGIEAFAGRVIVEGRPDENHYNPFGSVHGGYIATMLDAAIALAAQTTLNDDGGCATTDLKIAFLRPLTVKSSPLRCEATIINEGRTLLLGEARLLDVRGRLSAHATATCMIVGK